MTKMKIVVAGYIIRGPLGGLCWHHLQYILGLKQLGHDVLFVEDSDDFPGCYHPFTYECSKDPHFGLAFLKDLFALFGLGNQWAYFDAHTNVWYGKPRQEVLEFCGSSDILINVSAINPIRDWWGKIPVRLLIDTDPAFTQIKNLVDERSMAYTGRHTHHFTFAENINNDDCTIPKDGIFWLPTRQPVVPELWVMSGNRRQGNWTTVMQWDSYQQREFEGKSYGMKSMSFASFLDLPTALMEERLELAIGSVSAPKTQLSANGWIITDPLEASGTPNSFRKYLSMSKGEFSVAKHGYVTTNSGWFSERTLNYMACGKPVVIQDTGLSGLLPSGKGLLTFKNRDEAIEAFKRVSMDYDFHCLESRRIVEHEFEAGMVLNHLLERL